VLIKLSYGLSHRSDDFSRAFTEGTTKVVTTARPISNLKSQMTNGNEKTEKLLLQRSPSFFQFRAGGAGGRAQRQEDFVLQVVSPAGSKNP